MDQQLPECPLASRFEPADPGNFHPFSGLDTRPIRRIVVHITDGHPEVQKTIHHFQDPATRASAHFLISQQGEIVQMVKLDDTAWHACSANHDSIGIEHCARRPGEWNHLLPPGRPDPGLPLTRVQLAASAALVRWLCDRYALPIGRSFIQGHCEADLTTTHKDCPNSIWDWGQFMDLVVQGGEIPPRPLLTSPGGGE